MYYNMKFNTHFKFWWMKMLPITHLRLSGTSNIFRVELELQHDLKLKHSNEHRPASRIWDTYDDSVPTIAQCSMLAY